MLVAMAVLAVTVGCATQTLRLGPVITNISGVGDGSMIVERCLLEITEDRDYWSESTAKSAGVVECSSHPVVIVPRDN